MRSKVLVRWGALAGLGDEAGDPARGGSGDAASERA